LFIEINHLNGQLRKMLSWWGMHDDVGGFWVGWDDGSVSRLRNLREKITALSRWVA